MIRRRPPDHDAADGTGEAAGDAPEAKRKPSKGTLPSTARKAERKAEAVASKGEEA
jgi:hypothetical protein